MRRRYYDMMFVFNDEKFTSYEEMKPVAISYLIDNFASWVNEKYHYIDFGYGDMVFASEILECDSYSLAEYNQLGVYLDEKIAELFHVEADGKIDEAKTKEYSKKLDRDVYRKAKLNEVHNQINTNFKVALNAMLMKGQYEGYLDGDKTAKLIKSLNHIYMDFVKESMSRVETLVNESLGCENPDAGYNYWLYIFSDSAIWKDAILNFVEPLMKDEVFFVDFGTNIHDVEAEILENIDILLSDYFPIGKNMLKQIQMKDFNCLPFGGHAIEVNGNNY